MSTEPLKIVIYDNSLLSGPFVALCDCDVNETPINIRIKLVTVYVKSNQTT